MVSCKKDALIPQKLTGRKRLAFVVPPMFSGESPPPFDLLLREGDRRRLRPRSRAVLRRSLPQDPSSQEVPLYPVVCRYSCPFLAVKCLFPDRP